MPFRVNSTNSEGTAPNMPTDPHIESVSSDPANPRFRCKACLGRGMSNYEHHIKTRAHQEKVRRFEAQLAAEDQLLIGLAANGTEPTTEANAMMASGPLFEPDPNPLDTPCDPPSPISYARLLDATESLIDSLTKLPTDADDTNGHIRFDMLRQALETLDNLEDEENEDEELEDEEEETRDPAVARVRAQEAMDWHPFKNKEHTIDHADLRCQAPRMGYIAGTEGVVLREHLYLESVSRHLSQMSWRTRSSFPIWLLSPNYLTMAR
ncbi:uncharacterized protein MELLADRAFT_87566 [Melampsora larici-populina 98AG31]|uniref:Uncharacterized protein n=1 Tax=Melampsora larici-populina (strain 98AG31 / pathotype 3-4-7) TaxID=747676 RepID=F4RNT0_MELLP|nr:uncharacterized protein MELLADRAFT_87566 [Melampsora larici-populina 98AG31]EGG06038.1 hypothetical protein MELLADRAFT_87566 [Melampsora larici-populina 98AG31]